MKKNVLLLVSILVVIATFLTLKIVKQSEEDQALEKEWEKSFVEAYGSTLDNFYLLGDYDFQARWLTENEESEFGCRWTKHCVILKLATIAACPKGVVVDFDVFDSKNTKISSESSHAFIMQVGEIVNVELGSEKLTEKGFIEPTNAFCSEVLPAV